MKIMWPGDEDEAHLTIEYSDHFVMHSGIVFFEQAIDYCRDPCGECGTRVAGEFEYHSGRNPHF